MAGSFEKDEERYRDDKITAALQDMICDAPLEWTCEELLTDDVKGVWKGLYERECV